MECVTCMQQVGYDFAFVPFYIKIWKYYYENGQLRLYDDNDNKTYKSYYENGQLKEEGVLFGGKKPENNSHLVIERPESVNLVKPPTTIIIDTIQNIEINQVDS